MPRSRLISPEFWTTGAVIDCAPLTRLLLPGPGSPRVGGVEESLTASTPPPTDRKPLQSASPNDRAVRVAVELNRKFRLELVDDAMAQTMAIHSNRTM